MCLGPALSSDWHEIFVLDSVESSSSSSNWHEMINKLSQPTIIKPSKETTMTDGVLAKQPENEHCSSLKIILRIRMFVFLKKRC